ncbi:MAG: undecaprenyldiphospho-muramoylpentapeptide beta-N-acetylglucosaminyltransferase [Phyllobacteriaceae bacterium]|nr:undecaprenyldiphospho-muramoylpentapeptide beta-N-acetylglucosaminyltransferase [Phyllobacteriaceae bacterium]
MDKTVVLAAGGTGGHLFPAEALAHEMKARGWSVQLATDDRANRFAGSFPADAAHAFPAATVTSKNPLALARTGLKLWSGLRAASAMLGRVKPAVVVGFGGYPTFTPVFAATQRKIRTIIHEQNAVMGRANKALAGRVTAIAGGFLPEGGQYGAKTVVTGNPVRPAVIAATRVAYAPSAADEPFRLLVFGGSQGAQYFSGAVPAAIGLLEPALRDRIVITQQARPEDEAEVRAAFESLGVAAQVKPFFTDMAERIAAAHFVISRSGASTVSEIAAIGRPALLVPYPFALDHDQAANAAALEKAGGCMVRAQAALSPEIIAEILRAAMAEPERMAEVAMAARSVGRPDATRLLADLTEAIASGKSASDFLKGLLP